MFTWTPERSFAETREEISDARNYILRDIWYELNGGPYVSNEE